MKVCKCGKNSKSIQLDKADVATLYFVIVTLLVVVAIINIMLSVGLVGILILYFAIVAMARTLINHHNLRCGFRWAVLSIARVLQYF